MTERFDVVLFDTPIDNVVKSIVGDTSTFEDEPEVWW